MSLRVVAASALLLVSTTGCKETVSSSNVRTQGLAMLAEVTAYSESRSTVRVELRVGGDESNTYAKLSGGDELIAVADDDEKTMREVDDGVFEAEFDTGAADTEFSVRFERTEFDDALDNGGTLPAPFDITSSYPATAISRDDDVTFTWEDSGTDDDMRLELDDEVGEGCIFSDDVDINGDSGSYTLAGGTLDATSSQEPETCTVTATLSRRRSGSTDSVLDPESYFRLRQVRSVELLSGP